ncbi:hypothetical protein GLW20_09880 [Virgibacillus halodenitrificans]|nr:hypothetical protein [Virgibacillus halodenitrificans]
MSLSPAAITPQLNEMLNKLYNYLGTHYEKLKTKSPVILFLSIGYRNSRATVLSCNKTTFEKCWEELIQQAIHYQINEEQPVTYLKIDWVTQNENIAVYDFIQQMTSTKKNYFRKGISFDKNFSQAFLEQEINGNAFIKKAKENQRGYLDEKNIRFYIKKHRPQMKQIQFSQIDEVTVFSTNSIFCDGENCYPLLSDERNHGRRDTILNLKEIEDIVRGGMNYLSELNTASGKFIYGYFSCFDKQINHYNMLRHASTIYSMIEGYELFPNQNVKAAIERGLNYLVQTGIYQTQDNEKAYMIDGVESTNKEIKLGANAAAILAFTKYEEIIGDQSYRTYAQQLAKGILSLQQNDGSFHHVLHYPSLKLKEKHRIIYYDGEAAFALMRLYAIDRNRVWLQAVEKSFDYFIKNNYWQHHDHWLSYCTNELTIYRPIEKYFQFGLKNVQDKLPFIYQRITTYPTFLELTIAAFEMVQRIKENGFTYLLKNFDEQSLTKVIHHRAEYQRNGFFYPELAMYYKNPAKIMNTFFIRHHSFRSRIDDVEHYLSGYVHYYKLLNKEG